MKLFLGLLLLVLSHVASKAAEPAYFELRIYDVTTNKLEGVLERFRDAVEPIRRKHGINTIAYWTASNTNSDKFVYLMTGKTKAAFQQAEKEFGEDPDFKAAYSASNQKHGKTVDKITSIALAPSDAKLDLRAAATARAFDLRLYSVNPGKLEAFSSRWRDHAAPIYERHGMHSIGWWVAEQKDAEGHDVFVCLLAAENLAAIPKSIAAFHQDEEWQRVEKETEKDGKLRSGVTAFKLTAASFSPLK